MKLRSLKNDVKGMVDLGIVLMIGIAFAGLNRKARVFRWLDGDRIHNLDNKRYAHYYIFKHIPKQQFE